MARRYVWGRYTVIYREQTTIVTSILFPPGSVAYVADNYTQANNTYSLSGDIHRMAYSEGERFDSRDFPYLILDAESGDTMYESDHIRNSWYCIGNYLYIRYDDGTDDGRPENENITKHSYAAAQGNANSTLSSSNSRAYPSNGQSGSYWYLLRGNDVVDPASVSYDSEQILTQQVTIQAAASTGNKYGGTITYDYQVCVDGFSWVNVGSSTALSMSYTIPDTATQFQARVRARDNMGFTSSTWVTGPLATVRAPWVHHRLHRKNDQQVYDLVHFMTSAENVIHNNTSNVQATIDNIKQRLGLS